MEHEEFLFTHTMLKEFSEQLEKQIKDEDEAYNIYHDRFYDKCIKIGIYHPERFCEKFKDIAHEEFKHMLLLKVMHKQVIVDLEEEEKWFVPK